MRTTIRTTTRRTTGRAQRSTQGKPLGKTARRLLARLRASTDGRLTLDGVRDRIGAAELEAHGLATFALDFKAYRAAPRRAGHVLVYVPVGTLTLPAPTATPSRTPLDPDV